MKNHWSESTVSIFQKYTAPSRVFTLFIDANYLSIFLNILDLEMKYYVDNKEEFKLAIKEITEWRDYLIRNY